MSTTILNSTWIGTHKDIIPSTIIRTLDRLQCTACGLTKRNRKEINEGTGLHPPLPASELSADYQGLLSPPLHAITRDSFSFATPSANAAMQS